MRTKLEKPTQTSNRSVTNMALNLKNFSILGLRFVPRFVLQKALWRDGLNPEVSTRNEVVVAQAETIEISWNVGFPSQ